MQIPLGEELPDVISSNLRYPHAVPSLRPCPSAFPMAKLHGARTRSQSLSRVGFGLSTLGFIRSQGQMGCLRSTRVRFGRADPPGALLGGIIGILLGEKLLK
jgi:hypothetical protein